MKLLRLKITDPSGFRSLPCGFEHQFRSEERLRDELAKPADFAPFVCAGPNGSGKSNLLEALAAIFFQLEIFRVRPSFLPEVLQNEALNFSPVAFELDYLIRVPPEYIRTDGPVWAKVGVWKKSGESVRFQWENQGDFDTDVYESFRGSYADILLPQYVLGYSSGENEILSLPFFKLRFVQYDEYLQALKSQLHYFGKSEARLAYLDGGFSQAILLCNLLFQDADVLKPFREDIGIGKLKEFRIIIRRSVDVSEEEVEDFGVDNEALIRDIETGRYTVNLMKLLEADEKIREEAKRDQRSSLVDLEKIVPIVTRLKRCATCWFVDKLTDTLYLDYYVNDTTKQAFRENFRDMDINGNPALALFQAFQTLLTLNLYSVSDRLKTELYQSDSNYVTETVPTLASDQRIMRFKFVRFTKQGVAQPMMLKDLSDGEHQLLHSLGLCLLFRNTNSLFLLDEPETHFNPDWRSNFITRLRQCFNGTDDTHEMLVTTHAPFLISDSKKEKVLVFNKDKDSGTVSICNPDFNTLGASINRITMSEIFDKRETIGGRAQEILETFRSRFERGEDKNQLLAEIDHQLGDSVEKVLLIKTILDSMEERS